MHLAERLQLPDGYTARRYLGRQDHPAMTGVLAAYLEHGGDAEMPTIEQLDANYSHLSNCDPDTDIAIIEFDDRVVGYGRVIRADGEDGAIDCVVFAPTHPDHLTQSVVDAWFDAQEAHMLEWLDGDTRARYLAFAVHPGPGEPATGEAAWLEARGYTATGWGATLVRPDLENIPELRLPDGVEARPVRPDQMRRIWEAHLEAFRGEWDFQEPTPEMVDAELAEPYVDRTLWKIAWAGDQIVGQVKSYVNPQENLARGYRRGYTEEISTHHEWRNRGIAGALLAMSLRELRSRGMTEAALSVDTDNPGGAFQLYTNLGFVLTTYEAVYTKAISR